MVKFGELYYYILDENTACVGENIFASGDIVIPEKIEVDGKQYTVTRIDDAAFCGHMDVWSETPETRRIERLKAKIGEKKTYNINRFKSFFLQFADTIQRNLSVVCRCMTHI